MSSRHRSYLQQQRDILPRICDDDVEEVEEKCLSYRPVTNFGSMVSSSESTCDSEEDSSAEEMKGGVVKDDRMKIISRPVVKTKKSTNATCAKRATNEAIISVQLPSALQVHEKLLSIDDYLRSRFGNIMQETGEEAVPQPMDRKQRRVLARMRNEQSTKYRRSLRRRWLFGAPKEEWPRHVPYVAGGFRIVASNRLHSATPAEATHVIEWSPEYMSLQQQYEALVAGSGGDVNTLVMFLMHNPHHVESMLQLAMVFAHTGQMDRASDLIQRCLYNLESAHADGFSAGCRLSFSVPQNICYFTAVFRHMQIASMMGCPSVAANLCKYLLLLEPTRDPYYMLLFLDTHLITSQQFSQVCDICSDALTASYLSLPVPIDELLPNWSFSRCISENEGIESEASVAKLSALLLKWPLHAIQLGEVVLGDNTLSSNCSYFQHFITRGDAYPVLRHLACIYGVSSRGAWSRDSMRSWLRVSLFKAIAASEKQVCL